MEVIAIELDEAELIITASKHLSWNEEVHYGRADIIKMAKEVIMGKIKKTGAGKEVIESQFSDKDGNPYYPSKFVKKMHDIEKEPDFQGFAREVMSRLDEIANQNKKQSERIESMRAAFDFIFKDYFKEVAKDVGSLTDYISSLQKNDIHHITKEEAQKQLKLKTQLAKESLDLADPQAVQFASPEVKAVYDALMPEIREQIEYLDKRLVQGVNELGEIIADLTGASEGRISNDIGIVARRIDTHISNLQSSLSSIDSKVRDIRSARGGVYRN